MSPPKKVELIMNEVCKYYSVDYSQIKSPQKFSVHDRRYEARCMAMILIRRHTNYAFAWISEYFGFSPSRSHDYVKRLELNASLDKRIAKEIDEISILIPTKYT